MGTRWEREDYWPEFDYARPPHHQRVGWFIVVAWSATIAASLVVWMLIVYMIWRQFS
jgi:hypothetical protein